MAGLRVAVVGLEFGTTFLPGFVHHPDVAAVGVCDTNAATLRRVGDQFAVLPERRHGSLDAVLASHAYDAVALFTPIPEHAAHTIMVLAAGLHCACAVPMATTVEDLRAIIAAREQARRVYMMMETSLYTPEFLMLQDMHAAGEFGQIQFLHGVWHNNLENHPRYWRGLPPMHYITHPLAPILRLVGRRVGQVSCRGSGTMRAELHATYGNVFPVETAVFNLVERERGERPGSTAGGARMDAGSTSTPGQSPGLSGSYPLAANVTSMVMETALQNKETFDFWGTKQSFTWATFYDDRHALVRIHPARAGGPKSSPNTVFRFQAPSAHDRLPRELWHVSPRQAQPLLVHEFVTAIGEERASAVDVYDAATYSAPGLLAHQSALAGGAAVAVPAF